MATFVIDLVPLKCQDNVLKKLINKNFRKVLESGLPAYSLPLSDPEYTGQTLFDLLAEYLLDDEYSFLHNKYSYEETKNFILSCGVTPEHIVEWLKNLFATHRVLKSTKIIFEDENEHKFKKISKRVKDSYMSNLTDYKDEYNITCEEILEDEANEIKDENNTWAVRSKFGDFPVKFYKTNLNDNDYIVRRIVRYQYAIDTMCNYYDVREMRFINWLELDEEHKFATSV